jgi:hypothetical protein
MALRDKVTEAILEHFPVPEEKQYPGRPFYFNDYTDNLFCPMDKKVEQAYLEGDGDELLPYWKNGKLCLPKMGSIASSSAMSFNLLGNGPAVIPEDCALPAGTYELQYEKKMFTICAGKYPANLYVFLSNESSKTAIFCEMKQLEWLDPPKKLKDTYRNRRYYFRSDETAVNFPIDAFGVFQSVIDEVKQAAFTHYDAWQMLWHLLAIYNYTSYTTQKAVDTFSEYPSMADKYNFIILANVVNELPPERIRDKKTREEYLAALHQEPCEARRFLDIIRNSKIPHLFDNNCNAGIQVVYMSAQTFADTLEMPQDKRDYLKRYFT